MTEDKIELIIKIGENIIENSQNHKERDSILKILELDSLTSFMLGASLIFHGIDENPKACKSLVNKSLSILEELQEEVKFYN
tara:strand:- start:5170 stop:5415 length:246 start_codon:yes stop_codon:yes gene_type:complete